MSMHQRKTVVGVFSDHKTAERAVAELHEAGFRHDQIGIASRGTANEAWGDTVQQESSKAEKGAVAGLLTGAGLGALAGLGVMAGVIPVIGPAIAGGTLGIILSNAAGGAAVAGLTGALIGSGMPEDEAKYYHGEFEAGRTIVTVQAGDNADRAEMILRRHGAADMRTSGGSAAPAKSSSSTAGTAATSGRMATGGSSATHATGERKVQVVEEELHARKQPVEAGEVRVRKEVHTEQKTIEVPVRKEEVVIERHAVSGREGIRAGEIEPGEEIRVPVMEERVTVEKTPVVKEEVTIGKRVVEETERVAGQVRKEEVRVERAGDVDIHSRDDSGRR